MATTLPVPIEFTLPEGWQSATPDEVGAPGVAFIALHPESRDEFTANITVSGEIRTDDALLTSIADEAVAHLEQGGSVELQNRTEVGTSDAPGLTQVLILSTTVDGSQLDLVLSQVFLSVADAEEPHKRAVLQLTLTARTTQFDTVVGDFQQFVRTIRVSDEESGQQDHE
ncbi:hypothetical protein H0B56_01200 [Haloechinothrix sp. YIM 98757]|uniref:Lipoprotein LpqN n=1 Tax=Haloechinothrix aidingensis TaxID=2752311 RepID=A0A837ZVN5_9PSEU|nr:hypothetical protein [Haloechinothrix aidingensis]MBA0124154.1 hypothetical protein [Haloechinothrix aidingensis]